VDSGQLGGPLVRIANPGLDLYRRLAVATLSAAGGAD
jgi:hypothetical protein